MNAVVLQQKTHCECPSSVDGSYLVPQSCHTPTANHKFLAVTSLRENIVEPELNNEFTFLTVTATVYDPVTDTFKLNRSLMSAGASRGGNAAIYLLCRQANLQRLPHR